MGQLFSSAFLIFKGCLLKISYYDNQERIGAGKTTSAVVREFHREEEEVAQNDYDWVTSNLHPSEEYRNAPRAYSQALKDRARQFRILKMIPEARGQLGLKISRRLYRRDIGAIGARAITLPQRDYLTNIGEFRPITAKAMTTPNKKIITQVIITDDPISFPVLFPFLPAITTTAETKTLRVTQIRIDS